MLLYALCNKSLFNIDDMTLLVIACSNSSMYVCNVGNDVYLLRMSLRIELYIVCEILLNDVKCGMIYEVKFEKMLFIAVLN